MRRMTLLMAFSLLMVGCGEKRPDTDICIVSAKFLKRYCYNMRDDYNDDGSLKKDAKLKERATSTIQDLDRALIVDPVNPPDNKGLENLKAYIARLRKAAEKL